MRFQFSLAGLLIGIILCAIALAALRFASAMWASIAFTLTWLALVSSFIAAACGRTDARRGWLAFSLAGWSYLLVSFGPWCNINLRPRLLTTELAEYIQPKVQNTGRLNEDLDRVRTMQNAFRSSIIGRNSAGPPWGLFEQTLHCVVAWFLAVAARTVCNRCGAMPLNTFEAHRDSAESDRQR